jgi:hypothetical protein
MGDESGLHDGEGEEGKESGISGGNRNRSRSRDIRSRFDQQVSTSEEREATRVSTREADLALLRISGAVDVMADVTRVGEGG